MTNRQRIKRFDAGRASVGVTVLGIDYGRAHKGLAIGSTETKLALPLKILEHLSQTDFFEELRRIILAHNVELIVMGVPVTWPEDRSRPGMREETEKFANLISQTLNVPVKLMDERFTTNAARKLKLEHPQADEHALSAMLILQSYFDREG